jgi:nucleotide-binding universal stress UspA family protein
VLLVPVNYSPSSRAAVRLAVDLAIPVGGRIAFLRVLPAQMHMMSWRVTDDRQRITREDRRLRSFVEALLREAQGEPDYELVIAVGTAPHRRIADVAADHRAALIVMGAHRGGIRHWLFGGVAERTRRAARCPVVSVNATPAICGSRRLFAATPS